MSSSKVVVVKLDIYSLPDGETAHEESACDSEVGPDLEKRWEDSSYFQIKSDVFRASRTFFTESSPMPDEF